MTHQETIIDIIMAVLAHCKKDAGLYAKLEEINFFERLDNVLDNLLEESVGAVNDRILRMVADLASKNDALQKVPETKS